jgi:hypothetical protein
LAVQKSSIGNVGSIADLARAEKFRSPTVIVIGQVANFARQIAWFHELRQDGSSSLANIPAEQLKQRIVQELTN